MFSERPFADGRPTAFFVFNALRADAGRLTQQWLRRLRSFDEAGWATHAVLINKDPELAATIDALKAGGKMPAGTGTHHYALRDRRVRASWWGPLPQGSTIDPRVGDWLDWLTGQVPGAVVFADSPAAYPYISHMTNPLVTRVASVHASHLAPGADPVTGPLAPRFADRFDGHLDAFDLITVESAAQSADLRARFGSDLPVTVVPPFLRIPRPASVAATSGVAPERFARSGMSLLSVGPLDRASGHARVLDALPTILAKHPDARLWILGDGKQRDALVVQAAELGLADRVTFVPAGKDPDGHLRRSDVMIYAGSQESWPLAIGRALGLGIPVVAENIPYGPADLLTTPALGELVAPGTDLAEPIISLLDRRASMVSAQLASQVRAAAAPVLRDAEPAQVAARWVALGRQLADEACDHRSPSLLVETMSTQSRIIRLPGVLADNAADLAAWSCELPGLVEPAGWLTDPPQPAAEDNEDEPTEAHAHAAGITREVTAYLRSNALAFVAVESGTGFRVEFTDGTDTAPLLTTGFSERVIASRVGNALLQRHDDGTVWVTPHDELLYAESTDGRLLVRSGPDDPISDVNHAINWSVDLDWDQLRVTDDGAQFSGTLRARSLAPAPGSAPSLCVTDVGGYSRVVGRLSYTGEPQVVGLEWSAPVEGMLETDPLVATTELARGALALHLGFPGLLVPVGGLWTFGHRERISLEGPRGMVTLLPSPGGRVIVAPGKGLRARVSGMVRSATMRGTPSGP